MHAGFQDSTGQAYQVDPNLTFWKVKKNRIAYSLKTDVYLKIYDFGKYKFTLQVTEMHQNPLRLK